MELININNVTEWCANGLLQLLRELRTLTSVINTPHTVDGVMLIHTVNKRVHQDLMKH